LYKYQFKYQLGLVSTIYENGLKVYMKTLYDSEMQQSESP